MPVGNSHAWDKHTGADRTLTKSILTLSHPGLADDSISSISHTHCAMADLVGPLPDASCCPCPRAAYGAMPPEAKRGPEMQRQRAPGLMGISIQRLLRADALCHTHKLPRLRPVNWVPLGAQGVHGAPQPFGSIKDRPRATTADEQATGNYVRTGWPREPTRSSLAPGLQDGTSHKYSLHLLGGHWEHEHNYQRVDTTQWPT